MLDQTTFLQGINYLKANYINWSFDLNNDLQLKVWYKKFRNLEPSVYMGLVERYTDISKYAPNSPADLLEILKQQLTQKALDPNEAWQYMERLKYDNICSTNNIYAELKDKPALLKTFKELERDILMHHNVYLVNDFKKAYEKNLKIEVERQASVLTGSSIIFLT